MKNVLRVVPMVLVVLVALLASCAMPRVEQSAGPWGPSQSVGPGGVQQSAGPYGPSQSVGPGGVKQSAGPGGPSQSVSSGGVQQSGGTSRSGTSSGARPGASCRIQCADETATVECPSGKAPVCQCDAKPYATCRTPAKH